MLVRQIIYFSHPVSLACDGNCRKAWGINSRPKHQLSGDEDDVVWLADGELGDAPEDPGTYEGGCAKPRNESELLNKWCARECERSVLVDSGDGVARLKDWSARRYNYA